MTIVSFPFIGMSASDYQALQMIKLSKHLTMLICGNTTCRGASQLIGQELIKPSSIHNDDLLSLYGDEYLYLSCVSFVKEVGHFILASNWRGF